MTEDASDLLLFARVMEAGSFSRAAERLQWPKSTVSRRIAALEKRLGEKLLQRTTRSLRLTELGERVLDHARVIAQEVDHSFALALHRQAQPTGRLRVSMPGDVASHVLSDMLAQFVLQYPQVQLELDLSPRRVDLVAEGVDLALRMGDLPPDSQLVARRLADLSVGLYAAPSWLDLHGDPQCPEALLHMHGLVLGSPATEPRPWQLQRGEGAAGGAAQAAAAWQGLPQRITLANSPDVLLRLARQGVGITAVADRYVAPWVQAGELRRVLPDWCLPSAPAWAVMPERRLMPLRTRVFLDLLVQALNPA